MSAENPISQPEFKAKPFEANIRYPEWDKAPTTVIKQTYDSLDGLFHGIGPTGDFYREYLSDYTVSFLDSALNGIPQLYRKAREKGTERIHVAYNHLVESLEESSDTDSMEALSTAFVVFFHMPDMASHSLLPKGFSRRGVLRPPQTIGELYKRTAELKSTIVGIGNDTVDIHRYTPIDSPLYRTTTFFAVGEQLPDPAEELHKYQIKRNRESILNLLQDIDLSGL